jgi:hypothetical protein
VIGLKGVVSTIAVGLWVSCASLVYAQQPSPPSAGSAAGHVNDSLPGWLRLGAEFRERLEGFTSAGFTRDRDDVYWLSRFRVNASVAPRRGLSLQFQAQDARVARKDVGPTGVPFAGTLDLRTAFADIGGGGPVVVRAGRQELALGEQRLVGHVSWLNTARTFDGVRVTVRTRRLQVDGFGSSIVRVLPGRFDRSGNGNRFFGAYAAARGLPTGTSVEPYVFWRSDRRVATETGGLGTLGTATVGVRLTGRLPRHLDYGTEVAVQRGSIGADSVRAWAGHWQLRGSAPGRLGLRVTSEYNYASGDANPSDGIRGGFDQLYPTPHDKYGLADQVGWRNLHHARAGVDLSPWKSILLTGGYHSWWRAESADGLYAASGAAIVPANVTSAASHIGQEVDFQASRAWTPHLQLGIGYAHIIPGAFLRQSTPGAAYNSLFVMTTFAFLNGK